MEPVQARLSSSSSSSPALTAESPCFRIAAVAACSSTGHQGSGQRLLESLVRHVAPSPGKRLPGITLDHTLPSSLEQGPANTELAQQP